MFSGNVLSWRVSVCSAGLPVLVQYLDADLDNHHNVQSYGGDPFDMNFYLRLWGPRKALDI